MRNSQLIALVMICAVTFAAVALFSQLSGSPDIEVRTIPRRTQLGRLQRGAELGQGFRCEFDGLRRIEVALVPLGATAGTRLALVLRESAPDGQVLRRVEASSLPKTSGWGLFEFEPVEDSAGREFWWQLELVGERGQSPYSPYLRYHGQIGINMGWGSRIAKGTQFEGRLFDRHSLENAKGTYSRVPHPYLTAVSFAAETLRPVMGPTTLELWGPNQTPFESEPLRRVQLHSGEATHGGYAFFAFEPIEASRWVDIHFRLSVPRGARMVGADQGLSFLTWHGKRQGQPGLLGFSRGDRIQGDRSLVFRAISEPTLFDNLGRLWDRAGGRLALGLLLWTLAAGFLARTVKR